MTTLGAPARRCRRLEDRRRDRHRPEGRRRAFVLLSTAVWLSAALLVAGGPPAVAQQGAAAAAGGRIYNADDPIRVDADDLDIELPAEWPVYAYYDVYENHFLDRGDEQRIRALNINTLGEVPDSSWFENRLGAREMSIDELVRGPNAGGPPADGAWTVIGRPSGGVTPKFIIEDANRARFILKFDPVSHPEIASTAEMISSRFFHAFGYHVAEAYIVNLRKDRLQIAPGATFTDDVGKRSRIDQVDIDHWMDNAPVSEGGVYRALASRFVSGVGIGEFRFFGTRPDDPNDVLPHEHRRELRGYRVISAWLNHDDSRALNTYDTFIEENGRRFIKHYVLDFGSTLGSASIGANKPRGGNEYFLEGRWVWRSALTLGIWARPWLFAEYPDYPAAGNIEADHFVPELWKPEYPNAAFDNLDAADAFWAARIVARFSDEAVRRIVADAEISDPAAAEYLAEVIIARRDKVVGHWIAQTNPIDSLVLRGGGGSLRLAWDNAAIRAGAATGTATYSVRFSSFDNRDGAEIDLTEQETAEPSIAVPAAASSWGPADDFGYHYLRARIATRHPDFPHWERPVIVTLRDKGQGEIDIVGIERPREWPDEG